MKFSPKSLAVPVTAAALLMLSGCGSPNGYSYSNIGITVSPYCSDCGSFPIEYNPSGPQAGASGSVIYMAGGGGQGGVYQFTANVTNAPASTATWTIYPTPNLTIPNPPPSGTSQPTPGGSQVGFFTTASNNSNQTATGATVLYQAASSPPVYTGAALQQAQAMGIPQGDVLIVVSIPSDPNNPSASVTFSQLIQSYNSPTLYLSPQEPSTPSSTTSSVAQVARNTTFQFFGGGVGAVPCQTSSGCTYNGVAFAQYVADNNVIWQVGGSRATASSACNTPNGTNQSATQCPYGWISSTGLYTAPPTPPAALTGSGLAAGQVTVQLQSQQSSTVQSYAYISVF